MRDKKKKTNHYTNKELVAAILDPKRREKALEDVWYDKDLVQIVRKKFGRQIKDESDLTTVYNDTIIKFDKNVREGKFRGDSDWRTYIIGIFKYLMLHFYRNSKKLAKEKLPSIDHHINSPEEELISSQSKNITELIVEKLLKQISEICQKRLYAYYFEELSTKEIASQEDIETQSVKTRLLRCRKSLRKLIEANEGIMCIIKENASLWSKMKK
ncbi:MAG: sigma-70 family RNA polymerase sigma factor [Bacteroidota bacterium]